MKYFTIILFVSTFVNLMSSLGAKTYKISFYNVENLFDLKEDYCEYKEYSSAHSNWGLSTFRQKRSNIAKVISTLDADIIGLCEIENSNTLRLLLSVENLDKIYPYTWFEKAEKTAPNGMALLSKVPLISTQKIQIGPSDSISYRPILMATTLLGSETITIFVNHWPSKRNSEHYRCIAAQRIQQEINKLPNHRKYILMGDLNSHFNESDYTFDSTGINHILNSGRCTRERFSPWNRITIPEDGLYNPWIEVSSSNQFSYIYKGENSTLDHLLLSQTFLQAGGLQYQWNSFTPETLEGALLEDGVPHRWAMLRTNTGSVHLEDGYSDHLPISLLLTDSTIENLSDVTSHVDGFELSREGWKILSPKHQSELVQIDSNRKNSALRLWGNAHKNISFVEKQITAYPTDSAFCFWMIGTGKLSIRYRVENGPWLYLYKDGRTGKGAKYEEYQSKCWRKVILPIGVDKKIGMTLQLRSHANTSVDLYIDRVRLETKLHQK